MSPSVRIRRPTATLIVAALTLLLGACGEDEKNTQIAPRQSMAAPRARAVTAGPTCSATGAHAAHQGGFFQCQICHPCGGVLTDTFNTALSDGFVVTGTAVKGTNGDASCTVSCHGSQTVTWFSGPLGCSNCHGQWQSGAGVVSAHGVDPTKGLTGNAAVCTNCHNTANHFDPAMAIVSTNGTSVPVATATNAQITAFCKSCHSGSGKTFAGSAPPLLVGYDTSASGDWHGARRGSGFGGTLQPPFTVGVGVTLDCVACHEPHASTNAFLFAPTVNASSLTPGAISRQGVGADALCSKCHLGDRHQGCKLSGCHDGGNSAPAEPVPGNGPCFYCHGHEGIVNFEMPTWDSHPDFGKTYCWHCHGGNWFPATVTTTPPTVTNITVATLSTTTATITWTTNVYATSWVEYGDTDVTNITGNGSKLDTAHSVTIAGLQAGKTYKFRVRSSDGLRNTAEAPAQPLTFTTTSSSFEPAPTGLVAYVDPYVLNDGGTRQSPAVLTMKWNPVASAVGPTRYRLQVSTSPTFATVTIDQQNLSTTTTTVSLPATTWWPTVVTYYWRVQAIDSSNNLTSLWSSNTFDVYLYNDWSFLE